PAQAQIQRELAADAQVVLDEQRVDSGPRAEVVRIDGVIHCRRQSQQEPRVIETGSADSTLVGKERIEVPGRIHRTGLQVVRADVARFSAEFQSVPPQHDRSYI